MASLEELLILKRDHSSSLSGATEALKASTLRLPIVNGAKVLHFLIFHVNKYIQKSQSNFGCKPLNRQISLKSRMLWVQQLIWCRLWDLQYALYYLRWLSLVHSSCHTLGSDSGAFHFQFLPIACKLPFPVYSWHSHLHLLVVIYDHLVKTWWTRFLIQASDR